MNTPTRRMVLGASAAAVAAALAACSRSSTSGDSESTAPPAATGAVQWWDHFEPLEGALQGVFDAWAANGGGEVDRTVYNPNDMDQALQLALGSDQMPDVFSNLTGIPTPALVARELISPVTLDAAAEAATTGALFEGLHTFDGAVYAVPLFSHQQHSTLAWFDTEHVERAGGDPEAMTHTWDEFRRILRTIGENGETAGWVWNIAFDGRLQEQLIDLAQGAGQALAFNTSGTSPADVTDPTTGEYVFHSEAFLQALEFLQSLVADAAMLPASTSLDAREARARWAAGEAAVFFDGPWNAGVLNGQFTDFLPRVGVTNMPTPDGAGYSARGPSTGQFWQSSTSGHGEAVSALFSLLTTPEFSQSLAENMDQPPADLSVVADAEVDPTYARAIEIFSDWTRLAPSPLVRNPGVGSVIAEMEEIRPTLGEIVQGVIGGDIDDPAGALRSYSDSLASERDRAIEAVAAEGVEVSLEDWVFTDYELGTDYAAEQY